MKIDLIVGARPNFVKAAAILHAAKDYPQLKFSLVHTGQHHDIMSDPYFNDLRLPAPWQMFYLADEPVIAHRLSTIFFQLSIHFGNSRPDAVMVVGDTDSTLAGALAAAKMNIPVLHVEAGNRCGDMKMQEEINRVLVDSISTKLYTTSVFANNNLKREGRTPTLVGNVMVDTLYRFLPEAREKFSRAGQYAILTLHRAENVDDSARRYKLIHAVNDIARDISVIWPMHPRIANYAHAVAKHMTIVPPMGYLEFIAALEGAYFVMTDSGGVQEEATALHVPCLTLRDSTERPETVAYGTNTIVGTNAADIKENVFHLLNALPHRWKGCSEIPLWDGRAAYRIMEDICATLL